MNNNIGYSMNFEGMIQIKSERSTLPQIYILWIVPEKTKRKLPQKTLCSGNSFASMCEWGTKFKKMLWKNKIKMEDSRVFTKVWWVQFISLNLINEVWNKKL